MASELGRPRNAFEASLEAKFDCLVLIVQQAIETHPVPSHQAAIGRLIGKAEGIDQGVHAGAHDETVPAHSLLNCLLRLLGRCSACWDPDEKNDYGAQVHPEKAEPWLALKLRIADILGGSLGKHNADARRFAGV